MNTLQKKLNFMQNSVYVYALRHTGLLPSFSEYQCTAQCEVTFNFTVYAQQTSLCTAAQPDPDQLCFI